MKRNKRIISIIITAAMLLSAFTPAAFAEAGTGTVTFTNSEASVSGSSEGLTIKGTAVKITDSGTYTFKGSCSNGSITVKKGVTGVHIVLSGLNLTASATAPVTCNKGTQVTIEAAAGTVNTLADDSHNNDEAADYNEEIYPDVENAVIKCKDGSNVIICGSGTININSYGKNGIKGGSDLYEEDENGNATGTLLSEASLTVKDVTLNINATVNDGLKADKVLNILSGNISVSAADDGIKSDYTLNIGERGTAGPDITVTKSNEGIEAATVNIYSGKTAVTASDDGINAANSDLDGYNFSYNQYGGYVSVNCENGDGIDSNGTINLEGGTLEVYSPTAGDGDPLDADKGITLSGATVLGLGHSAMAQAITATVPYVVFGSAAQGGAPGGQGGPGMGGKIPDGSRPAGEASYETALGGSGTALVKAGSTLSIKDSSGNILYSAQAKRDASYVIFSSPELKSGESYTLYSGSTAAGTSAAGTTGSGSMQPGAPEEPGDAESPEKNDEGSSENSLSFLQRIIQWFKDIFEFIKSLFN